MEDIDLLTEINIMKKLKNTDAKCMSSYKFRDKSRDNIFIDIRKYVFAWLHVFMCAGGTQAKTLSIFCMCSGTV